MGGGKARRKKLRQQLATRATVATKKHTQVKPGQKRKGAPQQASASAPVSKSKKRRLQQVGSTSFKLCWQLQAMLAGLCPSRQLPLAFAVRLLKSTTSSTTVLRLTSELLCSVLLLQANKAAQAQGDALPLGFHPATRTLLVGDGNMSFARALARLFEGDGSCLVATAYDSEEQTQLKYEVGCDRRSACGTAPAWWRQGSLAQCGGRLVGVTCTSSSMRSTGKRA